jgi:non-ribosomal peptide synthase protein (TIGR01720 family)
MRGQAVQLPRKTTSFKYWAEEITRYAQTDRLVTEREFWLNILQSPEPILPLDFPDGISMNTRASACEVETWLSTALTDVLLHEVPQAYHTQMNDVLLTALVQAFANWTGQSRLLFDLEGHGREDIGADVDISRTVGWFTTIFPVLLELETTANPGEALKSIKEQLRGIPHRGIGYGLLRYLGGQLNTADIISNQQAPWSQPQISFNYLGQYKPFTPSDTVFQLSSEPSGPWYSPQGHRTYLIDVQGLVVNNQLRMSWTYSRQIHRQSTIEELANHFEAALQTLIEHCRRPEAGGYTPSDFPLASLNQEQLDKLLARKQRGQSA